VPPAARTRRIIHGEPHGRPADTSTRGEDAPLVVTAVAAVQHHAVRRAPHHDNDIVFEHNGTAARRSGARCSRATAPPHLSCQHAGRRRRQTGRRGPRMCQRSLEPCRAGQRRAGSGACARRTRSTGRACCSPPGALPPRATGPVRCANGTDRARRPSSSPRCRPQRHRSPGREL
jgi:hypothetical protein